ncbi:MAG: hypothetical protein AB9903_14325 [Vulcanimicrobiota bacterium]
MNIRTISILAAAALFIVTLLNGCGGGSAGSGGSSFYGGDSGTVTTPTTDTSSSQGSVLGTKGYVYVVSNAGKAGKKTASQEIIVLPSNSGVPQGFTVAAGYVVRSSSNPALFTRTDYNGYYDLSTSNSSGSSGDHIVIEDPNSQAEPICFPVIGEPLPAAQLTDIRIVPPFSDVDSAPWSIVSGSYEAFYLVGLSNEIWHPVSDAVSWSVSDSSLGSFFTGSSLFLANSSLATSASGTITAQCGGSSYELSTKVISQNDLGSITGTVNYENGLAASGLLVEVSVKSPNAVVQSPYFSYGIAISDQSGHYQVSRLPYGSYSVKVSSFLGSTLAESSIEVTGTIKKDFTVSSAAASMQTVVKTDDYTYKPGETIQAQLSMINMSSGSIETEYSSITFNLVYHSLTDYTSQVIATGTAGRGVIKVNGYGTATVPSQPVSITIPQSAETYGYYFLEASISSTPGFSVDAAFIMISNDDPTPWPTPTGSPEPWPTASPYPSPTDYPFPTPTYSPFPTPTPLPSLTPLPTYSPMPYPSPTSSPSSGNDSYLLSDIKYRLQDVYHEIYSAANQSYYGDDVSSQVNEGSNIQYRIKYVKNYLMPSLQSINYWSWQNELESVLNDLNRYAYYGGTYSDLYSAARGTDYVAGEVSSAQYSVNGIALKKKAAAKKKNR